MQTFLPYASFAESARCLDWRRLGNQRNEAKVIMRVLEGQPSRWANHPAVRMWVGYELALAAYGVEVCDEWRERGYVDHQRGWFMDRLLAGGRGGYPLPLWFGDEAFHASHRSNLLRKATEHYSQFGWTEPDSLPYVWPASKCPATHQHQAVALKVSEYHKRERSQARRLGAQQESTNEKRI